MEQTVSSLSPSQGLHSSSLTLLSSFLRFSLSFSASFMSKFLAVFALVFFIVALSSASPCSCLGTT